jgi:hypothetical protein
MTQTLTADDLTAIVGALLNATAASYNVAGSVGAKISTAAAISPAVAISTAAAVAVATGTLAIRTYHTFAQAITSTSTAALGSATKVWLAIKNSAADADSAAIVFVEATAGLTVLNGAAYATIAHGTLVVSGSSGAWVVTLGLDEAATALLAGLEGSKLVAEVKALVSGSTVPVWDGAAVVSAGIVRAVA